MKWIIEEEKRGKKVVSAVATTTLRQSGRKMDINLHARSRDVLDELIDLHTEHESFFCRVMELAAKEDERTSRAPSCSHMAISRDIPVIPNCIDEPDTRAPIAAPPASHSGIRTLLAVLITLVGVSVALNIGIILST